MKETRRALAWSLVLLMTCGAFAFSAATDIEAKVGQLWALHEDIARARTTLWVWENAYADRQIDLADPTLIYLEMRGAAYGDDRRAGLRTVVTADKEALLRSVKLTFAGLSRADFKKGWGDPGHLPPGAEGFTAEDARAQKDRLIKHYMDADARIREAEEGNLNALKVSIAELKLDIDKMEAELVALADELAAAVTGLQSGQDPKGPAPQKRFVHPRWKGAYVDNCLRFASHCGAPAAEKFCTLLDFSDVAAWKVDLDDPSSQHNRTVVLGEEEMVSGQRNPRRLCSPKGGGGTTASPTGKCVGFAFIECR